jgi:hypothetical protein
MPRRGRPGAPGVDGVDFDQEHWRPSSDLGSAAGSWPEAMRAWPVNGGPLEELRDTCPSLIAGAVWRMRGKVAQPGGGTPAQPGCGVSAQPGKKHRPSRGGDVPAQPGLRSAGLAI